MIVGRRELLVVYKMVTWQVMMSLGTRVCKEYERRRAHMKIAGTPGTKEITMGRMVGIEESLGNARKANG
jgi:hypothetical protein